jgi:hypothetical protein
MRFRFALLFAPAAVVLAAMGACSGQGEGQVCDQRAGNSGNDDCASGLVCSTQHGTPARCCPPSGTPATTPECSTTPGTGDASPAPPDGTAPLPEASPDVAAAGDGPLDSVVSDAPADGRGPEAGGGDSGSSDAPAE